MVDIPNLQFRFREIITTEPVYDTHTEEQESVSILYKTNWARILVVRKSEDPQSIIIEVEVSQPYSSVFPNSSSPLNPRQTSNKTRQILEQFIEYIKYILKLEASGFFIDFVGNDCLILASRRFKEMPNAEIFELLLPPLVK
ncbi:MAG: hypothetical protein ACFFCT_09655 [Candidatus Odinarchaeota archaeon]